MGLVVRNSHLSNAKHGFTLIELLVVIGAITMVLGFSLSGYASYNKKERVKQAILTLKSDLRQAQSAAISAEKPNTAALCAPSAYPCCVTFYGMRISYGASSYSIVHECNNGGSIVAVGPTETKTLNGLSFTTSGSFSFLALTKAVNVNSAIPIAITNGVDTFTLQVDPSGDMQTVGFSI